MMLVNPVSNFVKRGVIINNGANEEGLIKLKTLFNVSDGDVISYEDFADQCYIETYEKIVTTFDFVVLSGSSNFSARESIFKGEKQFIRQICEGDKSIPIFGICLGHQIIASALSQKEVVFKFPDMPEKWDSSLCRKESKAIEIGIQKLDKEMLRFDHGFYVSEDNLCSDFNVLQLCKDAKTEKIYVLFMKHKLKPVFSTQGHPEWSHESVGRNLVNHVFSEWFKPNESHEQIKM